MKTKIATMLVACVFLVRTASAHRIDEYLQATVLSLQTNRVDGSMRLIPGVVVASSVIAAIDTNGDGVFSQDEQRAYAQRVIADLSITLDGHSLQPTLVSWSFPQPADMHEGLGEIHLAYAVRLPPGGPDRSLIVANHRLSPSSVYLMNVTVPEDPDIQITAQKRDSLQTTYELDFQQSGSAIAGRPFWSSISPWLDGLQFSSLFRLGMRHIAEGTDHLLFLLTLLLPAPLLVSASRWASPASVRRSVLHILGIVTAFTIGHSITLSLAALNFVRVPSRPVEVLIAVSILVSALHALRPIVPGKEALIAVFFGLIHGLAFAATLDRLGLGHWERVAGILAFNLGIETMQMLVVALILPSLLLMSRTTAYPILRIGGAVFAGVASLAWIIERTFNVDTRVDSVVDALARHALVLAVALFVISLASKLLLAPSAHRTNLSTALDEPTLQPEL